jgi:hypothetical protein
MTGTASQVEVRQMIFHDPRYQAIKNNKAARR